MIIPCYVRFEIHTVVIMKHTVFWDVIACSMVEIYYLWEEPATFIFRVQELKAARICMKVQVPYLLSNPWNLSCFWMQWVDDGVTE